MVGAKIAPIWGGLGFAVFCCAVFAALFFGFAVFWLRRLAVRGAGGGDGGGAGGGAGGMVSQGAQREDARGAKGARLRRFLLRCFLLCCFSASPVFGCAVWLFGGLVEGLVGMVSQGAQREDARGAKGARLRCFFCFAVFWLRRLAVRGAGGRKGFSS